MNYKNLFLIFILIGILVMSVSLASAALCQNSKGYYEDCNSGKSSGYSKSKYKTFNTADYSKPVFKGSYGNYRYKMYRKGDSNPNRWFQPRGTYSGYSGGGPYFSGGYYSPYYSSWGYGGWGLGLGWGGYRGYYGGYGYGYSRPYFYSYF
jgi:hypothetical protein